MAKSDNQSTVETGKPDTAKDPAKQTPLTPGTPSAISGADGQANASGESADAKIANGEGTGSEAETTLTKATPSVTTATIVDAKPTHLQKVPVAPAAELAGRYRVKHGSYKVGSAYVGPGSVLDLSAHDAALGLSAGVLERVEQK